MPSCYHFYRLYNHSSGTCLPSGLDALAACVDRQDLGPVGAILWERRKQEKVGGRSVARSGACGHGSAIARNSRSGQVRLVPSERGIFATRNDASWIGAIRWV